MLGPWLPGTGRVGPKPLGPARGHARALLVRRLRMVIGKIEDVKVWEQANGILDQLEADPPLDSPDD